MNSALQRQITSIQNTSLLSAHRIKLPKRFEERGSLISNSRRIIDTKTGRSIIINVSNCLVVRRVLNTFFGD